MAKVILSLCDYSCIWSRPFAEAGAYVYAFDPKHDGKVEVERAGRGLIFKVPLTAQEAAYIVPRDWIGPHMGEIVGVIAQPPCTQFAGSGARWWKDKPAHLLDEALQIVDACMILIDAVKPGFWVMENPVGRLGRLRMGKPAMTYNPYEYAGWADDPNAEAYSKRTCLWGNFNAQGLQELKRPVDNLHGSAMWARYGGASERTKTMRSMTPIGFSRAFFEAHKEYVC